MKTVLLKLQMNAAISQKQLKQETEKLQTVSGGTLTAWMKGKIIHHR
jgi:hypothetical protein